MSAEALIDVVLDVAAGEAVDSTLAATVDHSKPTSVTPKRRTSGRPDVQTWYIEVDSPIGVLTVAAQEDAIIGLYMQTHRHGPTDVDRDSWLPDVNEASEVLNQARTQLSEYFAGTRTYFDLKLAPFGSEVQHKVWRALADIPYSETRSYGNIAETIGNPRASRAVGAANGMNPISIIVPCHRVIGSNGALTGFGGGIERKEWLLNHEARVAGKPATYGAGKRDLFSPSAEE